MNILPLLTHDYQKSIWGDKLAAYINSGSDIAIRERIIAWDKCDKSLDKIFEHIVPIFNILIAL
ncbi:hypothetical protein [Desulfovibrio sp.]|uniref:hypothetical protein n=1 Tax=Desulfovibrio sp. TaxID=885 RepID=UPI0025C44547|nr:hypothetical protein [Desulfovibrio sp.]